MKTQQFAVTHPFLHLPTKRDALLFDHILVVGMDEVLDLRLLAEHTRAELEWLVARNVVVPATIKVEAVDQQLRLSNGAPVPQFLQAAIMGLAHGRAAMAEQTITVLQTLRPKTDEADIRGAVSTIATALAEGLQEGIRIYAEAVATSRDFRAVPLLVHPPRPVAPSQPLSHIAAVSVVLEALPEPDDSTPWERVLEFRADEDAMAAARRLRLWTTRMATRVATENDLAEELESLASDYVAYMKLHEFKTRRSRLEAIVTTAAEVAEHLMKLKLGAIAKMLFSIGNHKLHLREAELKAPGREVAYVVRTRDAFGGGA